MLPDFGWSELLLIAIVLIVVVGPKDLPRLLRGFGKGLTSVRKMSDDFRRQMSDALKEAELDEIQQMASDVRELDPRNQLKDALNPLGEIGRDLNEDLKKAAGDIGETPMTPLDKAKPKSAAEMALDDSGSKARAAQKAKSETTAKAPTTKAAMAKKAAASKTAASASDARSGTKSSKSPARKTSAGNGAAKPKAAANPKRAAKPKASASKSSKPAAARKPARKSTAGTKSGDA